MAHYQLAQLNIATLKYPLESPEMADFVDNLDRINALAEASPGFVWWLWRPGKMPVAVANHRPGCRV